MSALPKNEETFYTDEPTVSCDGDALSAHPRVFLTVNARGFVDCPYCGRHFVLKDGAGSSAIH